MGAGKTFFHVSQNFLFWLGELQRLYIELRGAARPSRPRRYKSLLNRFIKGRIVGFLARGVSVIRKLFSTEAAGGFLHLTAAKKEPAYSSG
jgi:hypothetical protein